MIDGGSVNLGLGLLFLMLSAFFSSSEAAFLSLQKTRIAHMITIGVPGAKTVDRMIQQPERLLSTILLGNNIANVAFTVLITVLLVPLLGEGRGVLVATGVGISLLLLVGEVMPKTIAVRNAERLAIWYATPLKWIETLLWPLVVVLQRITHRLNSLFGAGSQLRASITEGELRTMIDIGEAEGTFDPAEAEMLENVFRFGDRQVREAMTPRTEMVAIENGARLRDFLDVYAKHTHTRFPVYKGTGDNIIGILSAKDVIKAISMKDIHHDDSVTDVIRDAFFVPETKRIAELFGEMRRSGNQMAIAVDEYGGIAGLVTLKQLTEEVVGPVGEEGIGPEEEFEAIDKNTFQVSGGMSIDEVNQELGINLPMGDFETIAGFLLDILGHFPEEGQHVDHPGLKFEIIEMQGLKIEAIKVVKGQRIEERT